MSRWLQADRSDFINKYHYDNQWSQSYDNTWFFKNATKSDILDDCKAIIEENDLRESLINDIRIKETDNGCIVRLPAESSMIKRLRSKGYTATPYGDYDSTDEKQLDRERDSNIYWFANKEK